LSTGRSIRADLDYAVGGPGAQSYACDSSPSSLGRDARAAPWVRSWQDVFFHGIGARKAGVPFFEQGDYAESQAGQDFRFAFGGIDRVDFQVNFSQDTVRVFFQNRYEWHPVYPFYSFLPGDEVRETNCVHAAAVELKSGTARDYWMKGSAEVLLSDLLHP
jgi:hypothetical protein